MTEKEFLKIREELDNAQDSVIPFAAVHNDTVAVVGDANETEIKKNDFKITYRIPKRNEDGTIGTMTQEVEYNDVFITPRQDMKVVRLLTQLLPYFRKVNNGKVEEYNDNEIIEIVSGMDDEIYDLMYKLVASVLRINPELVDYMTPVSVLVAVAQIIHSYPEVAKEADTFFG